MSSVTGDVVVDVLNNDKILSADILIFDANQNLDIDTEITLEANDITLRKGKSGLMQGGITLPNMKTDEIVLAVDSDNIVISPESLEKFNNQIDTGEEKVLNLVARGNRQTEGQYAGYYKYRDTKTGNDYYLDKALDEADISEIKVYNSSLEPLTNSTTIAALILVPILNTVSYQVRECNAWVTLSSVIKSESCKQVG